MTLRDWGSLALDEEGARLRARYFDRRDICAASAEPHAFVDARGNPIDAEFNGALCRGLLAACFKEDGELTLLDFARMPYRAA